MLLIVILCYAAVVAGGALSIRAAGRPTVLTGRLWTQLNVGFAIAVGLTVFLDPDRAQAGLLAAGALVAPIPLLRRRWFIFKATAPDIEEIVESSLSRVRVAFERAHPSWRLRTEGGELAIRATSPLHGMDVLAFGGDWRQSKAQLAMRTIRKRFESIVPAIRLRL